ncbi:hypothetical protein JB92DRAFT_3086274 [Gautieria morchelliformis]|nr:hypothetical protein JB92DRAFT_3086274 [Gautieria morchelliformis]
MISHWSGTEYKNMEKVFVSLMAHALLPNALKTAHAILDFIYLTRYPYHSKTTLQCLQDALDRFHQYKNTHYIESIKSRGIADGFSTELPERLLIDLCKVGYRASNREDYIIQMTKWITRHEKLYAFGAYVRWCDPHLTEIDDTEYEDQLDDAENEGDEEDEKPGLPNTPISKIMWDIGAPDFIRILSAFLKRKFPTYRTPVTEASRVDLYKPALITLQSIQRIDESKIKDTICATPLVSRDGRTAEKPAHFDTVLIHYNQKTQESGAFGYCAARVRAIFRLPPEIVCPHPVAYVEWYLSSIRRSCHLIPHFGRKSIEH